MVALAHLGHHARMLADAPERTLLRVRWLLALLWLALIASCWWDPWSAALTAPGSGVTGLTAAPRQIAGEQPGPVAYTLGPRLFWGVGIPATILVLVLLGHDAWRRICPLSAIAQLPRRLGWQRRRTLPDGRRQVALVAAGSWWARHALEIQFVLFAVGVSLRASVLSAHPQALAVVLTGVLVLALVVGVLFGGKTWCHYVCPMGVVQLAITGPRGLTTAPALGTLGQSMCRTSADAPACVGCNSPCPDVDLERAYWQRIPETSRRAVVYGYVGIAAGFLLYTQVLSGVGSAIWWDRGWLSPGWYLGGQAIPVPRVVAAPLTLLATSLVAIGLGFAAERIAARWSTPDHARHRTMTASTALALTLLISLGVLPGLGFLPAWLVWLIGTVALGAVAMWAHRTWWRESSAHEREQLAATMRRRLADLPIDLSPHLGGRQLADLGADEIHLLAQVVPALTKDGQRRFYRDVLTDAVSRGVSDGDEGRRLLTDLRQRLGIDEAEHRALLDTIASPTDNAGRVASYRAAIEHLVLDLVARGMPLAEALRSRAGAVERLRADCAVSDAEAGTALSGLGADDGPLRRAGAILEQQVRELAALSADCSGDDPAREFLRQALTHEATVIAGQALGVVEALGESGATLAAALAMDHPEAVAAALSQSGADWGTRLAPAILAAMADATPRPPDAMPDGLAALAQHADLLVAAAACQAATASQHVGAAELVKLVAGRAAADGRNDLAAAVTALTTATTQGLRVAVTLPDGRVHSGLPPLTIGRAVGNDVVLPSQHIGRQHVRLEVREGRLWCVDLGSANGVTVGSRRVDRDAAMLLPASTTLTLAPDLAVAIAVQPLAPERGDRLTLFLRLCATQLFAKLPRAEVWNLALAARQESAPAGSVIVALGEAVPTLRVVLHGEAEARAGERVLGLIRPGETIGELSLLTGRGASAEVRARSELLTATWPAEHIAALLRTSPDAATGMLVQVAGRLAATLAALTAPPIAPEIKPC